MQDSIRTVLVVEDEDGVRNLIRTLLRLSGFDVLACQNAEEALDLMRARGGKVNLVVTDINLGPDMDGIEMAESLRAIYPSLKVLYISGMEEQDRIVREVAGGQASFLMKPFTPGGLREKAGAMLSLVPAVTVSSR
ncbi:MAG TPA: response regulator [Fibrobacteria bacterium]|nr:response regulator [Fibrobacteria bacterium]